MWYYNNISLCDFVWLLIVIVWKNGSQPASVMIAGATSWKTCSACPKGTYQPIEAATGTASSEGCLLCFAVLRVLRNSQLRLQKRRYAFLVPWATTATRLDRRHVASARKAAITRIVWVGTLGFSHDGEWILMDVDVHWWKIDANEYHDWLRFFDFTGYYGDAFGLTACRACPEGTSTKQDGAIRPGLCNASLVPLGSEDVSNSISRFFQCVPVPFWYCSSW